MQDGNASNDFHNLNNEVRKNDKKKADESSSNNLFAILLFVGIAGISNHNETSQENEKENDNASEEVKIGEKMVHEGSKIGKGFVSRRPLKVKTVTEFDSSSRTAGHELIVS